MSKKVKRKSLLEAFNLKVFEEAKETADKINSELSDDPVSELSDDPVSELSDDPVSELSDDPVSELSDDPVSELSDDPVFWLNDNYANVLIYLIKKKDSIGNYKKISISTNCSISTVKRAVIKLEQTGFLKKGKPFIKGKLRGFTYKLNKKLIIYFMKVRGKN
jgi:hypothetical protein